MKKNIVKITAIAFVAILASCKGEPKNQTTAEEAVVTEEVAEVAGVTYTADAANSTIDWIGTKPTGTHTGTVNISEGEFVMGEEGITGGSFVIDMNSITVTDLEAGDGKEDLEAHLKGSVEGKEDHFFNVAEFPTASFEVTGMSNEGEKSMMEGNLTIRGISKNISFPVSVVNNGDMIEVTSETFAIDRTQWNVNYGSKSVFDNLGDKFINDNIELTIKVAAKKG
ncbi:YceI family protein [Robertkochia sediminum]|uniref:YceI family protein n=1 Tax=Robertkochia sediminum TaxID=2785326 RepID=UPI001931C73A|nr:YceI family protein [Robertkochia sediminum]MBL7472276.1 YceI family protein [Robertkochia sediminum]